MVMVCLREQCMGIMRMEDAYVLMWETINDHVFCILWETQNDHVLLRDCGRHGNHVSCMYIMGDTY